MTARTRMGDLVIAAAGGFGRELAAYARDAGFTVTGFLDDDPDAAAQLAGEDASAGLRGTIAAYSPGSDEEHVAIGVGHPATRLRVADALVARGARLATVIHPSAWVAPSATLGAGVAIAPFACVGPQVVVGDLGLLNTYASLGHDAVLGRGCVFSSYAVATGHTTLGDAVFLGTAAVIAPGQRVGGGGRGGAGGRLEKSSGPGRGSAGGYRPGGSRLDQVRRAAR
jgi:sugar O-acyltransferase (sialic acid O-acetyltransferase NeuD family)